MAPDTRDAFLGGRLLLRQPRAGDRAGMDAVLLAAACPARPGEAVLELGCGSGAAILCLGSRVPRLRLTGLERQPEVAELARENAAANGIALTVMTGDLAGMPAALRGASFDQVIANPPYFTAGTPPADARRGAARHEATPLALWIDAALRRLRPGGRLTLIQRADRLAGVLATLGGRAGDIAILPVAPRAGRPAGRVIVGARKGARAPLRLLAPLLLHAAPAHLRDGEDLTPEAQAILRGCGSLSLDATKPGDSASVL